MKKPTHKRLTAWLLTLVLVVTLLPGMGMTALAVEVGGEGTGPPAVEVVEPEGGNSGSDETVGTPLLPRAGDKKRGAQQILSMKEATIYATNKKQTPEHPTQPGDAALAAPHHGAGGGQLSEGKQCFC